MVKMFHGEFHFTKNSRVKFFVHGTSVNHVITQKP